MNIFPLIQLLLYCLHRILADNATTSKEDTVARRDEHAESFDDEDSLRVKRAFGKKDYLLPTNFPTLKRSDIPVTYRLHDDLLRYYRKGTRPVTHPKKMVHVTMSVFLYQIIKLVRFSNLFIC
ncbi:hypothetical protein WR25_08872 isoform C [Diploscapter pachys]|uniref:Neurotransmitter-gated ion-channel ligand-binding domain-containing protein n=1 Tax=Diploscapter pachys TaxID=2018661 RepID=A0A2A2JAW2_9BILA|nr:hypothetical protein WR25_08872 isoform C [Diploscapter pachys]